MILAATDLFAERGIDAVEPHEILERAGQRNASAIQYHFGSRAGLVVSVLQPRPDVRGPMEAEGMRRLDELAARSDPTTLRDAVEVLVQPSMAYLSTHEGRSLIRVAVQVMRTLPIELRVDPSMPSDRRVTTLIDSCLSTELPDAVRRERLGVARTLVVELIANRAREIEHGLAPHLGDEDFCAEVVAMTVGLLDAAAG